MQTPASIGHSESIKPALLLAVCGIIDDQERMVRENLLCLNLADTVAVDILRALPSSH